VYARKLTGTVAARERSSAERTLFAMAGDE
jgi:hypothetical protein